MAIISDLDERYIINNDYLKEIERISQLRIYLVRNKM